MILIGLLWVACSSQSEWTDDTLEKLAAEPALLETTLTNHPVDTQDLLLLTLAIRNPSEAGRFCKKVTTDAAKEKCQQVIGRPHLQLSKPQPSDVKPQKPK